MGRARRPHPIVKVLADRGVGSGWLSEQINYDRYYVSRVLHGHTKPTERFKRLCTIELGLTVEELFWPPAPALAGAR